jgi:hypothetical protein
MMQNVSPDELKWRLLILRGQDMVRPGMTPETAREDRGQPGGAGDEDGELITDEIQRTAM